MKITEEVVYIEKSTAEKIEKINLQKMWSI